MSNKVEAGFTLIGLMDGTTLNGFLRVEGLPLVQRYNKGTNAFVPDFEAAGFPEGNLPTAVVIIRDTTDGDVMIPTAGSVVWKYNGVELSFGEDDLCTTDGLEGVFKKIDSRSTVINSQSYNLPALQVRKNLVPISGYDNDRLSVSGSIEVGGNSVAFSEISKEVIIQEATGNAYSIKIDDDKGQQLRQENETLTATCHIYKDMNEITEFSGISFKWEKLSSSGNIPMGTNRTQSVTNSDVDGVLQLKCTVTIDGESLSEVICITDSTDPYYVIFTNSGITGNSIRPNETAVVTPKAVKRSDSSQVVTVSSWTWYIRDNAGNPFTLTGKDAATFNAASASITYADIKRANMGISGSVSATI